MNETDARCFALIRAVEECDAAGELLPLGPRRSATREAGPPSSPPDKPGDPAADAFLDRRVRILHGRLHSVRPELARLAEVTRWRLWTVAAVVVIALFVGLASAEIGPEQRLHLLSFPLVGLLAWNLGFYLFLVVAAFRRRPAAASAGAGLTVLWWSRLERVFRGASSVETASTLSTRVVAAFADSWTRCTATLRAAELRQILHLAAAALAVGLVAGLYVRGLVLEYRAGWESTFIDAPTLAMLLKIVFGPAAWLTGISLPDAAELERIAWGTGTHGENAARWIHLSAVTAGLLIVAPRLALAWQAGSQAARLRRNVQVYSIDGYTRPLLLAGSGGGESAVLVPIGYAPSEKVLTLMGELAATLLGGRGRLETFPTVAYGEEQARLDALSASLPLPPPWLITLVNLAITPEVETHGDWLRGLRPLVESGGISRLLLLADGTAYRRAVAAGEADRRVAERLASWQTLAAAHDLVFVYVDDGVTAAELAAALRPHIYPSLSVA